ncbi:hypothetical protein [Mycobacterium sp. 050134]|uniref:hypothetical protein n=1 Tax=Mycobacterium sp. 050134 TaxID=3096111 RepID=UPI002ED81D48
MMTRIKTLGTLLAGTAVVALTVGFGGMVVSPDGASAAPTTPSTSGSAPVKTVAAAPDVHHATLAACVSGLDC